MWIGRTDLVTDEIYIHCDDKCAGMVNKAQQILLRIVAPCFALPALLETLYKYFSSNCSNISFRQVVPAT